MQLPAIPVLPPLPSAPRYSVEKLGRDQLLLVAPRVVLTRVEVFRLIGELERLAVTL